MQHILNCPWLYGCFQWTRITMVLCCLEEITMTITSRIKSKSLSWWVSSRLNGVVCWNCAIVSAHPFTYRCHYARRCRRQKSKNRVYLIKLIFILVNMATWPDLMTKTQRRRGSAMYDFMIAVECRRYANIESSGTSGITHISCLVMEFK